jgi:hypothetical protein
VNYPLIISNYGTQSSSPSTILRASGVGDDHLRSCHRSQLEYTVVSAQDSLMKSCDERVALMDEILGAIRMLKVSSFIYHSVNFLSITVSIVDDKHTGYGLGEQFREACTQSS